MAPFATSNIEHVSATDHRIPRKPTPRGSDGPYGMRKGPIKELVSVYDQHNLKNDPEMDRDRALASGILARIGRPMVQPLDREFASAIKRDPSDVAIKVQYALRLIDRNEGALALPLFEDALARQPENEDALFGYALSCWELQRFADAANAWQRLIERTPSQRGYRAGFTTLLIQLGKLEDARAVAQSWIDYDPGMPDARFMMRNILKELGKIKEAQEQDRIGQMLMEKKK
jgi:tetratricopeptide (TPR) repeat protein